MALQVLDLFSGIGGFSLGLERAGMRTVAFCEIEPYCRAVLAKHWPHVPCHEDIRALRASDIPERVDVICGGFPCQDISVAGKRVGIDGERSGLWREYARLIGEIRPQYVIVENVAALLVRGLDRVLGDLAALGFDAEWHCIPASAVGAHHRRDRIWIVAYARRGGGWPQQVGELGGGCSPVAANDGSPEPVAEADDAGRPVRRQPQAFADVVLQRCHLARADAWLTEPDVGRVADGVPNRVDRLTALGNAVIPQIPEVIGRAVTQHAASIREAA
jgi:DNA (cytosine-5)-methyltransferase 1